jgi:hypothetical protein
MWHVCRITTALREQPLGMTEDNAEHDAWVEQSRLLLIAARGDHERVRGAVYALSLGAFRQLLFSPAIVFDYLFVSTPGLFGEAGYTDAEVDSLMPAIEAAVRGAWAVRAAL